MVENDHYGPCNSNKYKFTHLSCIWWTYNSHLQSDRILHFHQHSAHMHSHTCRHYHSCHFLQTRWCQRKTSMMIYDRMWHNQSHFEISLDCVACSNWYILFSLLPHPKQYRQVVRELRDNVFVNVNIFVSNFNFVLQFYFLGKNR